MMLSGVDAPAEIPTVSTPLNHSSLRSNSVGVHFRRDNFNTLDNKYYLKAVNYMERNLN